MKIEILGSLGRAARSQLEEGEIEAAWQEEARCWLVFFPLFCFFHGKIHPKKRMIKMGTGSPIFENLHYISIYHIISHYIT